MSNIRIQKKDRGLVLRPAVFHQIDYGLPSLFSCGLGTFYCLRNFPTAVNLVFGAFLIALGCSLLYFFVGQRMILDDQGVHLYRWCLRAGFLPWKEIRDWGTDFVKVRSNYSWGSGHQCYLYFTAVKGRTAGAGCLTFHITKDDYNSLKKSVIRRYVKAHMQQQEDIDE